MTTLLLPGLGATHAMYQSPWLELPDVVPIDWPKDQRFETLSEAASWCIEAHGLTPGTNLVGSSLGGMIALEIHRQIPVRRVVLLGSAILPSEIRTALLRLAPLSRVTPFSLVQKLAGLTDSRLGQMFAKVDPRFLQDMCTALSSWTGYHGSMNAVIRIHGELDRVIPCPGDCHIIPGAGHLLAMTHASICVAMVKKFFASDGP